MADEETSERKDLLDEAVLTVAGLADLAVSQLKQVLRPVRDVVRRSDLRELTREGHDDLKARGALAMKRLSTTEPHLERLAREAVRRRPSGDA